MMKRTFSYPVVFEEDEDGNVAASFPDFPEALTGGANEVDAFNEAADSLEEAVADRIARRDDIPAPSKLRPGKDYMLLVRLAAPTANKAALYLAMREVKVNNLELARRLGVDEKAVRRMLDPRHATKATSIAEALRALGYETETRLAPLVPRGRRAA